MEQSLTKLVRNFWPNFSPNPFSKSAWRRLLLSLFCVGIPFAPDIIGEIVRLGNTRHRVSENIFGPYSYNEYEGTVQWKLVKLYEHERWEGSWSLHVNTLCWPPQRNGRTNLVALIPPLNKLTSKGMADHRLVWLWEHLLLYLNMSITWD